MENQSSMCGIKLYPPLNFGMIEEDLYRCAIPNELNLNFLSTLNLKTIICLEKACLSKYFR
jgi:protein tyrosine/serine phosphatase